MGPLFILSILVSAVYGAPMPGAPGSALSDVRNKIVLAGKGFTVKTSGTEWNLNSDLSAADSSDASDFALVFNLKEPTLTGLMKITTAHLKKKMSNDEYGKLWIGEFSSLGFEILGSQNFSSENKADGLVLDMLHKKSKKRLRQAFFIKDKEVVLLTCEDGVDRFQSTLKECNQMIKNFSWIRR